MWSLGISLIELALGRFPFADSDDDDSDLSEFEGTLSPSRPLPPARTKAEKEKADKKKKRKSKGVSLQGGGMTMSILELLQHIVNEPAPRLTPEGRFPKEADDFVDSCLLKDPDARKTPKDLLVSLICKLQLKIFEKPPSSSLLRPEFLPVCFILIYVILVTKQSHLRLFLHFNYRNTRG